MNSNTIFERLQDKSTHRTSRILCDWNAPFTDPVTYGAKFKGGVICEQGLVLGNSTSITPGSIRYNNNNVELLKIDGSWKPLTSRASLDEDDFKNDAVVTFDNIGNIQASGVTIIDQDITDVKSIETEIIYPPTGDSLQINDILWPEGVGLEGQSLITDGNLSLNFQSVPIFNTGGITGGTNIKPNRLLATINDSEKPYLINTLKIYPSSHEHGLTGLIDISTDHIFSYRYEGIYSEGKYEDVITHSNWEFNDSTLKVTKRHIPIISGTSQTKSGFYGIFLAQNDLFSNPFHEYNNLNKAFLMQKFNAVSTGSLTKITINCGYRWFSGGSPPAGMTGNAFFRIGIFSGLDNGTLIGKSNVIEVSGDFSLFQGLGYFEELNFTEFNKNITLITGTTYYLGVLTQKGNFGEPVFEYGNGGSLEPNYGELYRLDYGVDVIPNVWNKFGDAALTMSYESLDSGLKSISFVENLPPTSNIDNIGSTGSVTWDDNYLYLKTGTGWGRLQFDKAF